MREDNDFIIGSLINRLMTLLLLVLVLTTVISVITMIAGISSLEFTMWTASLAFVIYWTGRLILKYQLSRKNNQQEGTTC